MWLFLNMNHYVPADLNFTLYMQNQRRQSSRVERTNAACTAQDSSMARAFMSKMRIEKQDAVGAIRACSSQLAQWKHFDQKEK